MAGGALADLDRRLAPRLEAEGVSVRVVDLRWIVPLDTDMLRREARRCGRVLVVDEESARTVEDGAGGEEGEDGE